MRINVSQIREAHRRIWRLWDAAMRSPDPHKPHRFALFARAVIGHAKWEEASGDPYFTSPHVLDEHAEVERLVNSLASYPFSEGIREQTLRRLTHHFKEEERDLAARQFTFRF